jgi:hypothetical protein
LTPITGSIDSFLVAAVMAITGLPQAYRRQVVFGFMAFDFVAAWTGGALGASASATAGFAIVAAFLALYLLGKGPATFVLLPVLCSIDNLIMGASDGPLQLWPAAVEGACSGVFAWMGFLLGSVLATRMKGTAE